MATDQGKLNNHRQYQKYQFPTADLEASFATILPVMNLCGWQKALRKGRHWRVEAVSSAHSYVVIVCTAS